MANLVIPRREIWTQQPQGLHKIDWNNKFAKSLLFVSVADGPNLVSPLATPTFAGSFRRSVGAAGRCVKGPTTQSAGTVTLPASLSIPANQNYALAIFATPSTDSGSIVSHDFPGANINNLALSASGLTATLDNNSSGTASYSGTKPELFMACRIGNQAYAYTPSGTTANAITGTRAQSITSVVTGRPSGNNFVNTETYMVMVFSKSFSVSEYKDFARNPWQIFAPRETRLFVTASSGAVNATASGAFPSVSLSANTAGASGSASASGSLAAITLSAPTATASAGGSATASGSFSALSISPATATAAAGATASGALAAISLSAPSATATGTTAGNAVATGTPAQITISHATAIAIGSAVASGGLQSIGITAPSATASAGNGNATATGAWSSVSITAPTGYASSGFIRAPAGSGPTVIQPGSYRMRQSVTSRPGNTGGRRY